MIRVPYTNTNLVTSYCIEVPVHKDYYNYKRQCHVDNIKYYYIIRPHTVADPEGCMGSLELPLLFITYYS